MIYKLIIKYTILAWSSLMFISLIFWQKPLIILGNSIYYLLISLQPNTKLFWVNTHAPPGLLLYVSLLVVLPVIAGIFLILYGGQKLRIKD